MKALALALATLTLALPFSAHGAPQDVEQAEEAVPGDQHTAYEGIASIRGSIAGLQGNVLTLDPGGDAELTQLVAKDETQVSVVRGTERVAFDDLRPGDEVRAYFEVEGETRVLLRIDAETDGSDARR